MSRLQKISFILLFLIGIFTQILPLVRSGLSYPYGIGFWGPNGHDMVWHLSLINHIHNPLSIDLPIYSGQKLMNYHPFFDILINLISRLTHISASLWLFQLFPIFSASALLFLSFYLGNAITKNFRGGMILMFLTAFSNSFGWLVTFLRYQNFSGESLFWAMQSPSNQINPPFNLSLIFILILIIIVHKHQYNPILNKFESLFVVTILALLPITKAYSAIFGFIFFGLFSLKSITSRKHWHNLILLGLAFILAIFLYTRFNFLSSGLIIYRPFWFINSMIESPDRLYLPQLANVRYALESSGKIGPRLLILWFSTFTIFIIGNFAWRILGLRSVFHRPDFFKTNLLINLIILVLFPTFFIQKGTSWNTIQFIYYALFIGNIFLTIFISDVLPNIFGKITFILISLSSLLAFFGTIPNYIGLVPPSAIPLPEYQALKFLSNQPSGTVLTAPYDPYLKTHFNFTPIPLYAYSTTAYVSAYSRHFTYLEDEMNLDNSGYDVTSRRQASENFFKQLNENQDRGFLVNNQISYIYLAGLEKDIHPLNTQKLYITKIFENSAALIYRVQR